MGNAAGAKRCKQCGLVAGAASETCTLCAVEKPATEMSMLDALRAVAILSLVSVGAAPPAHLLSASSDLPAFDSAESDRPY